MIKNFRILDGYGLSVAEGDGFTTNWHDLLNCVELSVSVVFTGGSPAGTVSIITSNDWPDNVNGLVPASAWNPTTPTVKNSPALDGSVYPGATATVAGAGIYKIAIQNMGERWFQIGFVGTGSFTSTVTVMYCAKTTNG